LNVLTAKRVLDEGVNIPEITEAFILASSTVKREWIQRRGRILRKCDKVNKKVARIHDFLVIPPETELLSDINVRTILKGELERIMEFAMLSQNAASLGGPIETINPIFLQYFG